MEKNICTMCNIENHNNIFYNKLSDCKACNINRGVRRYHISKDKTSVQRKNYYEKKR